MQMPPNEHSYSSLKEYAQVTSNTEFDLCMDGTAALLLYRKKVQGSNLVAELELSVESLHVPPGFPQSTSVSSHNPKVCRLGLLTSGMVAHLCDDDLSSMYPTSHFSSAGIGSSFLTILNI